MKTKEYTYGYFTIVWSSGKCIHAAEGIKRLPEVYNLLQGLGLSLKIQV